MELTASVVSTGETTSRLTGKSTVNVSGKVAAMGARLMGSVSEQLIKDFFANLLKNIDAQPAPAAAAVAQPSQAAPAAQPSLHVVPPPAAPAPAQSINGFAFIWAVIKSFIGGLFSGKKCGAVNVRPASLKAFATLAPPSALRISAIVLAAGLSSRMGEQPKMLLDIAGMPMIRRTLLNVLAFGPTETVVVTGHRAEDVEEAIDGWPVRCVRNPRYDEGQPTSVAAGVRALTAPAMP